MGRELQYQHPVTSRRNNSGLARAFLAGGIAASCALLGIYAGSRLPGLSLSLQDSLARAAGANAAPDDIALVTIDEKSIAELGRFPWPRGVLAKVIDAVAQLQPKVIALDVLITDRSSPEEDRLLSESVARAGNVVVSAELVEDGGRVRWLRPLPSVELAAAGVGHVQVASESDGAARTLLAEASDDEGHVLRASAVEAIRVAGGSRPDSVISGDGFLMVGNLRIPVTYPAPTASLRTEQGSAAVRRAASLPIHYLGPAGAFAARSFSASDVLQGRIPAGVLRGAYVLIGATAASMGVRFATPFVHAADARGDQHGGLVSGVEVLANALDTILRGRFYSSTGDGLNFLFCLLAAVLMLAAVNRFEGLWLGGAALGAAAAWVLAVFVAYTELRLSLPLFPVALSFFAAGGCGLIWRSFDASAALDQGILALEAAQGRLIPMPGIEESLRTVCSLPGIRGAKVIRDGKVIAAHGWTPAAETSGVLQLRPGVSLFLTDAQEGAPPDEAHRKLAAVVVNAALDGPGASAPAGLPNGLEAKARAIEQVQRNVARQMTFLTSAFGSVEDGILTASPEGIVRYANPKAAALLGARELTGRNLLELLFGTASDALLIRLLVGRESDERQIHVRGRMLTVRLAPIVGAGEQETFGIVASLSDVTRQHELAQTKNDVMNLVSHEMRTPLTAIQGMTELLSQYEIEPVRRRELHLAIHDEVKRVGRMISEYLDITRLESGKSPVRFEPLRLEPVIERAVLMFEPVALQKRIMLRSRSANLPPILGDVDLLTRALQNLISNAIKYSGPETGVEIAAFAENGHVFLTVTDAGPGIPETDREKIFEKFYRVPRLADADTPGTGLGLALVREIAGIHGGSIAVEANPAGTGSRFVLQLPLEPHGPAGAL